MFGEILQLIANRSKKFGWFDDRPEWNISKQYSKGKGTLEIYSWWFMERKGYDKKRPPELTCNLL